MTFDGSRRWLADAARARALSGVHRELRPRRAESDTLDLASNDYLGLAHDRRVIEAAVRAVRRWGAGATGSRLVTGTTQLHADLEEALAELLGAPGALVFSSGFMANLAAVAALSGPDCLVVSDRGNHASLVDGCRLSRSRVAVTAHGDLAAAERVLSDRSERRALVVIDAINSADGDLLPLAEWHRLARRHGALLVIDDAHGVGVRGQGRGAVAEVGLAAEPDVITTVTLSKSVGSQGGAVLGGPDVIDHLIDTARPFMFDTGLSPGATGAALRAVRIIASEPDRAAAVLVRACDLAAVAGVPTPDAAIVPVVIGEAQTALDAATALRGHRIEVGCFRPPSVPSGTARLRITARATLAERDIERFRVGYAAVNCWARVE